MSLLHENRGSSPLARGLLALDVDPPGPPRIIPARAGFTRPWTPGSSPPGDHPRSRGVYGSTTSASLTHGGSSPLARGLRLHPLRRAVRRGIIPARAGFTPTWASTCTGWSDHPRSRGVYCPGAGRPLPETGSSPLARGLPQRGHGFRAIPGIIPARAGFTRPCSPSAPEPQDHPRSRGVYRFEDDLDSLADGSSPLARGLLLVIMVVSILGGIIPARAGFTW